MPCGKLNPNYGNHILSERYKNNPELAKEKNSRPREQNGRCVPIQMIDNSTVYSFKFIGEAAEYLIHNGYTKNKISTIRSRIIKSIKDNEQYLGFNFKKV